jgi:hypothetical protein
VQVVILVWIVRMDWEVFFRCLGRALGCLRVWGSCVEDCDS